MSLVSIILVVLAVPPQAAPARHGPEAAEHQANQVAPPAATKGLAGSVDFECDFGTTADRDCDGWPDGWTRRQGAGFHDFLKIGIAVDKSDPARGTMLLFEMNGGSAEVGSPPIPINTPSYSYVLEGECRLTGLVHDDARVSLRLLNQQGKTLQSQACTISSQPENREWQIFSIGPFVPNPRTTQASFTLQVAPRDKGQDIRGQAAFRRLRLRRLPRLTVNTSSPLNIYTDREEVEVLCEIAGIPNPRSLLHFELKDHEGRILDTFSQPLTAMNDDIVRVPWKPSVPDFGFYQVQVRWEGEKKDTLRPAATFVVLRPAPLPKAGQFGWTLPAGESPFSSAQMAALLARSGVHWAKYPVTFSPADAGAADRIAWFAEKLSLHGIEMVGVLDHPPSKSAGPIAEILEDADTWKPWVDPILTRLSLKIRWWQLGGDHDTSLVRDPRLAEKTREFKKHLERFGQTVKLGTGWQWLIPPPAADVSLAMQSLTSDPPLTPLELETYLARPATSTASAAPQRWVVLEALPKSEYSQATRAQDLATRMLASQVAGADAVFFSSPFDPETGLMQADGMPGELYLPWRTTAAAITGSQYLGQMPLPGGSTNYVFVRDSEAVMAIWNDKPTVETMYFGEDVRQLDLWGRETIPPPGPDPTQPQQRVSAGPFVSFVTGVNATITRFKLAAEFESPQVESIFGREQIIYLRLKNFFPQGVSGEVRLAAPQGWKADSLGTRFRLGPGEEIRHPIPITLLAEANSGPQLLRLDFSLMADRGYRFDVQRTLQLGLADVAIEVTSRLREDGLLEVTQQVTNLTAKPLSFQCVLFTPGRRREARQLLAPPNVQSPLVFLLEKGESLIGQKLTVRAEEHGGGRVLSYSLTAER
jgi:hypothetical protein